MGWYNRGILYQRRRHLSGIGSGDAKGVGKYRYPSYPRVIPSFITRRSSSHPTHHHRRRRRRRRRHFHNIVNHPHRALRRSSDTRTSDTPLASVRGIAPGVRRHRRRRRSTREVVPTRRRGRGVKERSLITCDCLLQSRVVDFSC